MDQQSFSQAYRHFIEHIIGVTEKSMVRTRKTVRIFTNSGTTKSRKIFGVLGRMANPSRIKQLACSGAQNRERENENRTG
jgi:hypothetical protein